MEKILFTITTGILSLIASYYTHNKVTKYKKRKR